MEFWGGRLAYGCSRRGKPRNETITQGFFGKEGRGPSIATRPPCSPYKEARTRTTLLGAIKEQVTCWRGGVMVWLVTD
jgi:hypothetical protein